MGILDNIAKTIKDASSIAIICHTNPDPDTVCSALALYYSLRYFNKEAHIYCETPPAGKVKEIDGADIINRYYSPSYAVCVCVDCSDLKRLGEDVDVFYSARTTICIDHHKTNTKFAALNYVDEFAAATCEMIYKLILRLDPESIDDKIAKILYTGIVADSGAFSFPSTTTDTMMIAGELMRHNFSSSDVCYEMIKKIPKRVFNLKIRALSALETYDKHIIGVIKFTQTDFMLTRTTMEDTSGIINDVLNIETIKIAVAVTELTSDSFKVSMRSKGDYDVSRVAEVYGGGGHKNASGCELHGEYAVVMKRLLTECRKELCRALSIC